MENQISENHLELCFQLREFFRTGHKFGDLVSVDTKSFISDITSRTPTPLTPRPAKTRAGNSTEEPIWPQNWAIDRVDFRKAVVRLEKAANLPSSFAGRHSRESSKDSSNLQFASPRLTLPDKLPQLNLADQILRARDQQGPQISSPLSSAPPTPLSTDVSTGIPETTTPEGSPNMSGFPGPSNQGRPNTAPSSDATPGPTFSAAQRSEIADIVAAAVRAIQMQQPTPPPTSETHPIGQGSTPTGFTKEWTADDIGFFDPGLEGDGPVVNVGRHVFYRDIYAFVDRLKDMMNLRGEDKLRAVLPQCFRGSALIWHSTELSDMEKDLLRQASLSSWYQAMINRFKQRTPMALASLQQSRYTMTDAQSGKDPRLFAQDIFRSAKAANMESIHNQLTIAWNNLDWRFRANIPEPTATTSVRKFLEQLDSMSDIWHEMARSQNLEQKPRGRFQNPRRTQDYPGYPVRSNPPPSPYQYQGAYPNYQPFYRQPNARQHDRPEYQNRNPPPDPRYSREKPSGSAPALPPIRQPLQITGGNANQSASGSPHPGTKSKDNRDYKGKGRAYVTEEDKHENEMDNPPDNEYYHGSDPELDYYDPSNDQDQHEAEANFSIHARTFDCRKCKAVFPSNNQLHKHVRQTRCEKPRTADFLTTDEPTANHVMDIPILESTVDSSKDIGTGFGFRGWTYAKALIALSIKGNEAQVCLDTGCSVTLADRSFIKIHGAHYTIRRMATPLNVRGLGTNKHETSEYIIASIYFAGKNPQGKPVRGVIRREVHLVDNLKANMLIGNDILGPEGISIDGANSKATIASCQGMTIPIEIRTLTKGMINKALHARSTTVIPPHSMTAIPIHHSNLPSDRDFLFEPSDSNASLFAHAIDASTNCIMAKNDSPQSIKISRNARLGRITEIQYPNAFHVDSDIRDYAERKPTRSHKESWFKRVLKAAMLAYTAVAAVSSNSGRGKSADVVLSNGITIHDSTPQAVTAFSDLVDQYPDLWKSEGFAKLPEDQWMHIPLRSDWETRISGKAKVYPLGTEDKKLVDQTFDDLHAKGRLKYTTNSTPFSYPVFVVWKMVNGQRKGRVVIDIRGLNAITLPDAYPLPLQSDVISAVKGCDYLSVIDCASFFYQWRVHPSDRHKLTVVSHRGQETFQVAVMGYKNSSSYVQRQVDRLFRGLSFVKAFIDDIIIFSKTMKEHVTHLREIFETLTKNGISVNPKKAFIGYSSVQLLGQKVDSLGLTTDEEKLKAIAKLKFPRTLKQLEHYLGLTGWMREYVPNYAGVSQPLQDRKTLLLKSSPIAGSPRRKFAQRTHILDPTSAEKQAYEAIQTALSKPRHLTHADVEKQLYGDIDASKEFGIGVMIYHVRDETDQTTLYPSRSNILPILFLSRQLKPAERNYWPTELEIAGIVFTIRKIRHMIESSKKPTILFTDHGSALGIAKQTSLTTSSTDRLNLRLIRASEYIQRFNIIIKHKPGKQHIVPDALSRLDSENDDANTPDSGELDALLGCAMENRNRYPSKSEELDALFTTTLVEMDPDFKSKIISGYSLDLKWKKVMNILSKDPVTKLPFELDNDGLIYRTDHVAIGHAYESRRLCIPANTIPDILELAHSSARHPGFAKCFDIISSSWYIHGLTRHLRQYLRHCPECQIFQTRRHKPYGSLQPILAPEVPFHTLTMDFILALPVSDPDNFDSIMSVTCKFSKRVTLVPGKTTWKAKDWATELLTRLEIMDWGLPKAIISDRDAKFLSELWQTWFNKLGVKLLYSTAYHPQSDGQSERSNQTIEIALRYHLAMMENPRNWPHCLSTIQSHMNNTITSLGKTPNEIVYGFTPVQPTDLVRQTDVSNSFQQASTLLRKQIADSIAWAQMTMKHDYDRKMQPLNLKPGDYVLLRLHKGYIMPSTKLLGPKLSQQYAGPFRIMEKVGNLAYRIDLPRHWRIHPVVSVAQIEPVPDPSTDPYKRQRPNEPEPIHVEGDTPTIKSFEIERLINKRMTARRGAEYLVRWKGYGPQWDEWRNLEELQNALELVQDYEKSMNNAVTIPGRRPRIMNQPSNPMTNSRRTISKPSNESSPSSPPNTRTDKPTKNSPSNDDSRTIRRSTRKKEPPRGRAGIF